MGAKKGKKDAIKQLSWERKGGSYCRRESVLVQQEEIRLCFHAYVSENGELFNQLFLTLMIHP